MINWFRQLYLIMYCISFKPLLNDIGKYKNKTVTNITRVNKWKNSVYINVNTLTSRKDIIV